MVDAAGTNVYSYTLLNQLASESGRWANDTVSYGYTNRLRNAMILQQPNGPAWAQYYGYDIAKRLAAVSTPEGLFSYTHSGPTLLSTNLSLPNGAAIMNSYDAVARLTGTYLKNASGTVLNSHVYTYNNGNQRTRQTRTIGDYVDYTYDNTGQLQSAVGKESGGTTNRWHEQFGYAYDAAQNLQYRTNNALIQTFTVDSLNQLASASRSGTLTVAGTTTTNASSVIVNGTNTASRYSDSTFATTGFTLANGNNSFTAVASDSLGRSDTSTVNVNLPSTASFTYDQNGNMTSDGLLDYAYDDENQLIGITSSNSWKTVFSYDGKMRLRKRTESNYVGSAWVKASETRYIYDGMLPIQERDVNNIPLVTYTRGNDLSGSLQGAGGIGGLLARTDNTLYVIGSPSAHAFYHSDGNGNVTALVNDKQIVAAKYTYDPYGNTLSQSGPLADANSYRFSSKEVHRKSGLYYYGYRFYSPNLQRWPNRDPLMEAPSSLGQRKRPAQLAKRTTSVTWVSFAGQGPNLYQYAENDPVSHVDPYGLWGCKVLGVNIGSGDPTFDFDFTTDDYTDLRDEYERRSGPLFLMGNAAEKSAAFYKFKNPFLNAQALWFAGLWFGNQIGHGIATIGEAIDPSNSRAE